MTSFAACSIGELRYILAASCVEALEPDLIILDEFQRFKDLLNPDEAPGALARGLFEYQHEASSARVLLLSATPYKMHTLAHDDGEDHYRHFLDTVRFLTGGTPPAWSGCCATTATSCCRKPGRRLRGEKRDALEAGLRPVMIRTERLADTGDRDGMLAEISSHAQLMPSELDAYRSAALIGAGQTTARHGKLMRKHNAVARRLLDRQGDLAITQVQLGSARDHDDDLADTATPRRPQVQWLARWPQARRCR